MWFSYVKDFWTQRWSPYHCCITLASSTISYYFLELHDSSFKTDVTKAFLLRFNSRPCRTEILIFLHYESDFCPRCISFCQQISFQIFEEMRSTVHFVSLETGELAKNTFHLWHQCFLLLYFRSLDDRRDVPENFIRHLSPLFFPFFSSRCVFEVQACPLTRCLSISFFDGFSSAFLENGLCRRVRPPDSDFRHTYIIVLAFVSLF